MNSIRIKAGLLRRLKNRNASANEAASTLEDGTSSVLEYPRRAKRKHRFRTFKHYEDDGAEAMYSASDDDFPFEEKVQAVMAETRPRRKKRDSKTSSDKASAVERHNPTVHMISVPYGALTASVDANFFTRFRYCFLNSWMNLLFLAAPVAIAFHYGFGHHPSHNQSIAIFITSILAIIQLTASLTLAIEEFTMYLGEVLGALLCSMFQNVPLLMIGNFCLFQNQMTVVKDMVVGSLLLNLLLTLGACFFFGGLNRLEQYFNVTVAQYTTQILMLGILVALFPSIFHRSVSEVNDYHELSHACAIIALTSFGAYLLFQLKSHRDLFHADARNQPRKAHKTIYGQRPEQKAGTSTVNDTKTASGTSYLAPPEAEDEIDVSPVLTKSWAIFLLCFSGTLLGLCSKSLVDSIPYITKPGAIPLPFVGFFIIPLSTNLSEILCVVTVAIKDKMDLSIGAIVDDCIHVVLFTLPCLAIISWIANPGQFARDSLSLRLDEPYSICLAISIFLVNQMIQDGKSYWLSGLFLISAYALAVVGVWYTLPE